jgi:transposase-like protein
MTRKELRRNEWIARIADYRASGQSMQAWSNQNHVSKDQLRYWLRTLRDHTAPAETSPTRFVPLILQDPVPHAPSTASLHIHVGSARIELASGFDPRLLREVVAALSPSC